MEKKKIFVKDILQMIPETVTYFNLYCVKYSTGWGEYISYKDKYKYRKQLEMYDECEVVKILPVANDEITLYVQVE